LGQQPTAIGQGQFASVGQCDRPSGAVDQLDGERLLQAYLDAHGRLGEVETLGCLCEGTVFGDGDEPAQVTAGTSYRGTRCPTLYHGTRLRRRTTSIESRGCVGASDIFAPGPTWTRSRAEDTFFSSRNSMGSLGVDLLA
jgi:hypothetical protein